MLSRKDSISMTVSKDQADRIFKELSNNPAYYVHKLDYSDDSSRISIVYFKSREVGLKRYLVEVLI